MAAKKSLSMRNRKLSFFGSIKVGLPILIYFFFLAHVTNAAIEERPPSDDTILPPSFQSGGSGETIAQNNGQIYTKTAFYKVCAAVPCDWLL